MKQAKFLKPLIIFLSIMMYFSQTGKVVFAAPPTVTITVGGGTLVAVGGRIGDYTYESIVQWSSDGTSCTVTPGNFSGTSGSQDVTFQSDTTYTATCTGPGGTASASATVRVPDGSIAPVSVPAPNSTVTLNWTSTHSPDSCKVYDGVSKFSNLLASGGATGSVVVNNVSEGDDFGLNCDGGNPIQIITACDGCFVAQLIVGSGTVDPGDPLDPVTGDIKCVNNVGLEVDGPCTVVSGNATNIGWTSSGASDCEVRVGSAPGSPLFETGPSGSYSTNALTVSKTYVLSCDGGLGLMQLIDSVTVNVISATLQVSSNTANNNGPFVDGPLELPATGVQVRLKATCGASGGSGRITPGNINFAGTSYYGNVTFNISPKTWTLTCYPSPNQAGTPTATDFVTVQLTTADFTFACNTVSKTVTAGASTVFDTTVTAINGFANPVTVSVTAGLPANASFTPVTVTPTAVASVPVSTQVTTPPGTSNLTFTATGGGKSHTCISQLIVTNGTPYLVSLDIAPPDASILVNDTQSYTAQASYSNGSSAAVTGSTTFGSSDENIARSSGGADFLGTDNGVVTITGTYIEGGITTADTANLEVGSGSGGLTASVTCPSGAHSCTIPYNTSINLTWTSTGADNGCSMSPALIPPVNTESGTASTGNLTATTVYTVTCTGPDKNLPPATDTTTVIVNPASESFANADKDVTSVNGVAITNGSCNGGTDSVTKTFTSGDAVSFKINLCNTGSSTASSITVSDELTNLAKPATGWNAKYNGANITPTESGSSPNQTLTFTIPGSITVGSTKALTFDAVVTPPSPITNTIYRFQNIARISNTNGAWTASTPLYLFYAGSKVPSKQEVAP
jgi:hypothetical protein